MILLPTTPAAWAIKLSQLLQHIQTSTGESMYPIKVQEIACDISKHFFPSEPLVRVCGDTFSTEFDGMMTKGNGQWGIVYNDAITSRGRINFTLAHEFGHYLLHRADLESGIQCGRNEMMKWDASQRNIEAEANEFASHLLMPINIFREKVDGETLDLNLFQNIAEYFDVSLTATLLKWVTFTEKRAIIVVAKDGFVKWAKASDTAFKSGLFLAYKKNTIELPAQSLAARRDPFFDNMAGTDHAAGIWPFREGVREATLLADAYDTTISLLLFSDDTPVRDFGEEAPEEDTFDRFQRLAING
jgi:Zn-dependent peptidase ImmA (M78 family)